MKLGATLLSDGRAEFSVWAPHTNKVFLFIKAGKNGQETATPARIAGEQIEMERQQSNSTVYNLTVDNVHEADEYYFILDSSHNDMFKTEGALLNRRDVYARWTDFNSNTCYITDPSAFEWVEFNTPPWDELVMYEIHPGSYVGYNDGLDESPMSIYEKVTSKLDFIKDELGFNCLQLMPVHEFGGEWGYNPRLLLNVHGKYGTPDQLRTLVNEAHKRGIAVIFDMVLNHGSAKLNSLWAYDGYAKDGGIYFEGGGDTPWGKKFSFHKQEIRDMLFASARTFLAEYKGDGLRFDSVHNNPWNMLQDFTWRLHTEFPGKILIAEITPENPKVVTAAGFDSCWVHSAYFDMLKCLKGGFGGGNFPLVKTAISLHSGFTRPWNCVKYMLGCHDGIGDKHNGGMDGGIHRYTIDLCGGRGNWHARAKCRMLWALNMCAPGFPMMFMGSDTCQSGWWNVDHHHRYNWALTKDDVGKQMMCVIKDLNALRMAQEGLRKDYGRPAFTHEDGGRGILAFKRCTANNVCLVVLNASDAQWDRSDYGMHVAEGGGTKWKEMFNSQSIQYGGWENSGNHGRDVHTGPDGRIGINLPKWSCLVFVKV